MHCAWRCKECDLHHEFTCKLIVNQKDRQIEVKEFKKPLFEWHMDLTPQPEASLSTEKWVKSTNDSPTQLPVSLLLGTHANHSEICKLVPQSHTAATQEEQNKYTHNTHLMCLLKHKNMLNHTGNKRQCLDKFCKPRACYNLQMDYRWMGNLSLLYNSDTTDL